jgi:amidohydrolase
MNKAEIIKHAASIVDNILNDLIEFRHALHKIPEIGLQEYETSNLIRKMLKKNNLSSLPPYLETDVVGLINPEKTQKNVTLRADIDAIPQYELNDFSYKSTRKDMMHACGHDGHSAILLGTTIILEQIKKYLPGSVRYIFQPGEEGLRGAKSLLDKNLFSENKPDAVLGLHNYPTLPEGVFYGKSGTFSSSVTPFKINIIGKSTHSSMPEKGVDPIIVASKIVNEFNRIANDPKDVLFKTNLQVCKFYSGTAINVIPSNALLEGTARCYQTKQVDTIPLTIKNTVADFCNKYNAEYEVTISPALHMIKNNKKLVELAKRNVIEMFGKKFWVDKKTPFKFSEDFSDYHKTFPGLYLCIGAGKNRANLHTQNYDFNDNIIKSAILFWIKMTLDIFYK